MCLCKLACENSLVASLSSSWDEANTQAPYHSWILSSSSTFPLFLNQTHYIPSNKNTITVMLMISKPTITPEENDDPMIFVHSQKNLASL